MRRYSIGMTKEKASEILDMWILGGNIKELIQNSGSNLMAFYTLVWEDVELSEKYIRSRKIKAEIDVDDLIDIADNGTDAMRDRLKIDTRKWRASKYNSRDYGDKIEHNINQTMDISGVLRDALARSPLQAIDITPKETGLEPVSLNSPNENESDDDIFS